MMTNSSAAIGTIAGSKAYFLFVFEYVANCHIVTLEKSLETAAILMSRMSGSTPAFLCTLNFLEKPNQKILKIYELFEPFICIVIEK